MFSLNFDASCLCEEDDFYREIAGKNSFRGRKISDISPRIKFQEDTVTKIANNNFDRLNETEEDKIERERREEEARLSIERLKREHEQRVLAYEKRLLVEEKEEQELQKKAEEYRKNEEKERKKRIEAHDKRVQTLMRNQLRQRERLKAQRRKKSLL
jgi:hypothetical protein